MKKAISFFTAAIVLLSSQGMTAKAADPDKSYEDLATLTEYYAFRSDLLRDYRNVEPQMKAVVLGIPDKIIYDTKFFDEYGKEVSPIKNITGYETNIFYTKADKIIAESTEFRDLNNDKTAMITVWDNTSRTITETHEQPAVLTIQDRTSHLMSTNGEKLRWSMRYYPNEVADSTRYTAVCISGTSSEIDVIRENNGFVLKGDVNGKYLCSTLSGKSDDSDYGNQYNYEFNAVQDVFIRFDKKGGLSLYIDRDNDGEFTDKVKAGDINCDGRIDAADASEILSKYSWLSTHYDLFLDLSQTYDSLSLTFMNYDYNGDGKINASDASEVLMDYSRLSTI
ncbi:hypothetical protein SAMN02910353_00387 [Ruminococcus sp. YRD2003]|uniref:dockerin type I domain-containing protein n=1 Tax=Ruminococcus sp. YRD2003 TaxID=1452313 RepID=UPI0008D5CE87|nr:hypothetical protein SAMN02910353_00387 [Ruminococcus flavefaciens]